MHVLVLRPYRKDNIYFRTIEEREKINTTKKVLHHQIYTTFLINFFFLSIPILNFKFDTALEDSIQYQTQQ